MPCECECELDSAWSWRPHSSAALAGDFPLSALSPCIRLRVISTILQCLYSGERARWDVCKLHKRELRQEYADGGGQRRWRLVRKPEITKGPAIDRRLATLYGHSRENGNVGKFVYFVVRGTGEIVLD